MTLTFCPDPWLDSPCDCPQLEALDPERQALINETAAYMLWKASGSRFGPCSVTIRPCGDDRARCHRCGGGFTGHACCGCRIISEIVLPGPVFSVTEVIVDGETVPEADYRVDDYAWLVNLTGSWPHCSDLLAGAEEAGSFIITYEQGLPPPPGGGVMVGELACELAKAFCGDTSCQLPGRIASKTRQGVQVTYDDLEDGRIGIASIDDWLAQVNSKRRPSSVFSPDLPQHRITTWP